MADSGTKRGVYNCPNCGAAATPESVRCAYCHSSLATLVCSQCYGAIFTGMRHCPRCGETASTGKQVEDAKRKCPRCNVNFLLLKAGPKDLNECPSCGGLWVDNHTLQEICTNQEQQQAIMGFNPETAAGISASAVPSGRMYIPCPVCNRLMNRRQFARCSGVVVDWCKAHGTWFDRNELRQIIQFIQAGGLQKAREREKLELEEERQSLREERRNLEMLSSRAGNLEISSPQNSQNLDLLNLLGSIWNSLKTRD
jgi:Zn-finger nucleic acid-binding protein